MFTLLTGFYTDPNATRATELQECLRRNIEHPTISKICLFIEDDSIAPELPKIECVKHGRRLDFDFLFDFANSKLVADNVIIANADIYFDETLSPEIECDNRQMMCLSRWDIWPDGSQHHNGNAGSHDAWIFKSPLPKFQCNWRLGTWACDGRIAFEATSAGIQLINPSYSIRAIHLHNSRVRRYDSTIDVPGKVGIVSSSTYKPSAPSLLLPSVPMGGTTARISCKQRMGCRLNRLDIGISSHSNVHRPFFQLPPYLIGKMFTQEVANVTSRMDIKFLSSGEIYIMIGTDWEGVTKNRSYLADAGGTRLHDATTIVGTAFETWMIHREVGATLSIPAQVALVADDITLIDDVKLFSQIGQDAWIVDDVFPSKMHGYFVDVGAYDGIQFSNTFTLEKIGWDGICIEPGHSFQKLKENRKCICTNDLICNTQKDVIFVDDDLYSSFKVNRHERSRYRNLHGNTLTSVLEAHGAPTFIEYLSIDTEGAELEVLEGLDLNKYKIGSMTIEHNFAVDHRSKIRAFLKSHGYRVAREVQQDDWFLPML